MAGRKRTIDRRKHTRFQAAEGAYAAVSPRSRKLGQIQNISLGGICFKYIDTDEDTPPSARQKQTLFLSSIGYYVGDIPFRTISDYECHSQTEFTDLKVRKCHLEFKNLNLKQIFDLNHYLRNNVTQEEAIPVF